jgi:DNA mismatch repair protein PMS2
MASAVRVLGTKLTGDFRKKTTQLRTDGATSVRASVGALWGPKQLDNLVDLDLSFEVIPEKSVLRRPREDCSSIGNQYVFPGLDLAIPTLFFHKGSDFVLLLPTWFSRIHVEGLISKFTPGAGRTGTDRQFFFINGRPCAPAKVQKGINEVYRTFNANQAPFVIADFLLPTGVSI